MIALKYDSVALDNRARMKDYETEDRLKAEEIAESKKNHDFVQFTRSGLASMMLIKNPFSMRIFMFLAKEMDKQNGLIVSQSTLSDIFETTRQTISASLKDLIEKKLVKTLKSGSSTIYCLNTNVVWTQERTNLHLARFKATVIISKDEQEKQKTLKTDKIKHITKNTDI